MEPAELSIIRQRLVARVDDRAIKLHPLIDVVHDVIGALAQLKLDTRFGTRRLKVERERISLTDTAGAGENLPRREESQQSAEHRRRELGLAAHEIVFMAAKRRAGVVIDIFFDERNTPRSTKAGQRRLQELISGEVVTDKIAEMQTLGRRVLNVAHIEIKTAAI